jgi:hypothetical protein
MSERPPRPPFDTVRAAFILVAFVIVIYAIVVLIGFGVCVYHHDELVAGHFKCDAENRLVDLLSAALASALAFAGGLMRGPGANRSDDQPPPPPPRKD